MTTPAPPPQQQPPPQPVQGLDDAVLALALAGILVGTAAYASSVHLIAAGLRDRFRLTSAAASALESVLGLVMEHPPARTGVIGVASEQAGRVNAARRAQFVIAASKRVLQATVEARSRNLPVAGAVRRQLEAERRYYEMHQAAMWNRARAAGQVDLAAAEFGPLLGWNTVLDAKTSPECRRADRHNFYAGAMPDIGFPGSAHPQCRCFPGPPYPGGRLLASHRRHVRAA